MTSVVLMEEQHEKLRRVVDDWRGQIVDKLAKLHDNPFEASSTINVGDVNTDPIHVLAEPKDSSTLLSLIETDNVPLNKFITVLAYDCLQISRLCRQASRNFYAQLLLFGHHSCPQEVHLEGEPQKEFGHSLSFFMEFSELVCRLRAVLNNLVRQVCSVYSAETKNKLCTSLTNIHIPSVFSSFADGLTVFLTVDEIMAQNGSIKYYMSLFMRMLDAVKTEPSKFGMLPENVDCLDRVVNQLDGLLQVGLFQQFVQEDFMMNDSMQKLKSNKQFFEESSFCLREGLSDILSRLDTWKEIPSDRRRIIGYLGLFMFHSWLTGFEDAFDEYIQDHLASLHKTQIDLTLVHYTHFMTKDSFFHMKMKKAKFKDHHSKGLPQGQYYRNEDKDQGEDIVFKTIPRSRHYKFKECKVQVGQISSLIEVMFNVLSLLSSVMLVFGIQCPYSLDIKHYGEVLEDNV